LRRTRSSHFALLGKIHRVVKKICHTWRNRPDSTAKKSANLGINLTPEAPTFSPCFAVQEHSMRLRPLHPNQYSRFSNSNLPASIFWKNQECRCKIESSDLALLQSSPHVAAGLGSSSVFQKESSHADHTVHRRANFVAHVSQEIQISCALPPSRITRLGHLDLKIFPLRMSFRTPQVRTTCLSSPRIAKRRSRIHGWTIVMPDAILQFVFVPWTIPTELCHRGRSPSKILFKTTVLESS